jgi:hypothetical protein
MLRGILSVKHTDFAEIIGALLRKILGIPLTSHYIMPPFLSLAGDPGLAVTHREI